MYSYLKHCLMQRMEKTGMIVRLHNLSVRAPIMADASSVALLIGVCNRLEAGLGRATEEDIYESWHAPLFDLCKDAWIIESRCGQIVGYADVRYRSEVSEALTDGFVMNIDVHPDYRGRGIGTLLLWLVEERARQLMLDLPVQQRVTLQVSISSVNSQAQNLVKRERYNAVQRFWRLIIDMEEVSTRSMVASLPGGQLKLDLMIADTPSHRRSDAQYEELYTVQQYDVYEKVLRFGDSQVVERMRDVHCANA
jgi:GNAT superfamily N-acetyltransferase